MSDGVLAGGFNGARVSQAVTEIGSRKIQGHKRVYLRPKNVSFVSGYAWEMMK